MVYTQKLPTPPQFNKQFEYPKMTKCTMVSGVRYYLDDENYKHYSVTTITGKKKLSHDDVPRASENSQRLFESKNKESMDLGTCVHEYIEDHIKGLPRRKRSWFDLNRHSHLYDLGSKMADSVIINGFNDVEEVWASEEILYAPKLYAGTTDCIAVYKGKPSIIDFKTCKEMRDKYYQEHYWIQAAAYAFAHNELFGTEISRVVIFYVDRNLTFRPYVVDGQELSEYLIKWGDKITEFRKINSEFF